MHLTPGPGDSPTAATAMSVWYLVPWTINDDDDDS